MRGNMNLIKKLLFILFLVLIIIASYFAFSFADRHSKKPENTLKPDKNVNLKQTDESGLTDFHNYKFKYTYTINTKGTFKKLKFLVFIPQNIDERQYVTINSISPKPDNMQKTPNSEIGEFVFNNLSGSKTITMEGTAKVRTYDYITAQKINKNIDNETDLSPYLKDEKYIEVNDPYIQKIAQTIQGNTKEEIIQNIYEYLQKNIKYTPIKEDIGAKEALKRKQGKCTQFAVSMAALCRAKKIPAKIVTGSMLEEGKNAHAWVEIYFDQYGWVAYDPTFEGVHVKEITPDGKEKRYILYNSKDTYLDYIILDKDHVNRPVLQFEADNLKENSVYLTKNLEFEKINKP